MTQEINLGDDGIDWELCRFCGGEIVIQHRECRCEDCDQVYLAPVSEMFDE